MTESSTSTKLAKWGRVLIGGLLSAGIAGYAINFISGSLDIKIILLWFLLGAIIAIFIRKNIPAILVWLLVSVIISLLPALLFSQ